MDCDDTTITCQVITDWLNPQGISIRKVTYRIATLRLIRSDTREMFVEVSTDKLPKALRLELRGIVVHKKFMSEGKASITFSQNRCMLFLSNAPPCLLMNFLKTLFVKMSGEAKGTQLNDNVYKNVQAHMLSEKPSAFQGVSPVTNAEIVRAQRLAGMSKSSATTPSPPTKKRRLERSSVEDDSGTDKSSGPQKKKQFVPSPLSLEPPLQLNDEQNQVLKACIDGKNIFFTGSAGTGKSFLLKKIISVLPPDGTVATASTGAAACLIGTYMLNCL